MKLKFTKYSEPLMIPALNYLLAKCKSLEDLTISFGDSLFDEDVLHRGCKVQLPPLDFEGQCYNYQLSRLKKINQAEDIGTYEQQPSLIQTGKFINGKALNSSGDRVPLQIVYRQSSYFEVSISKVGIAFAIKHIARIYEQLPQWPQRQAKHCTQKASCDSQCNVHAKYRSSERPLQGYRRAHY
ncbi:hypothetical protein FGO68_gene2898 [Halteria grandinella]|uniref:Uncharacterized protein n=1 Tax=Halteria grandinella TaxID=5974 RepID=A0A8J8NUJ6_HALGN|nr:hypothetical protein FGO68_gene2898 [Halteria grandinella]